ncbi:MAG: hypothetical protein V1916_02840 [Patescibacteria group bacterium]
MNATIDDRHEAAIEKKLSRRLQKRRPGMQVSGARVKQLQRIIISRGSRRA